MSSKNSSAWIDSTIALNSRKAIAKDWSNCQLCRICSFTKLKFIYSTHTDRRDIWHDHIPQSREQIPLLYVVEAPDEEAHLFRKSPLSTQDHKLLKQLTIEAGFTSYGITTLISCVPYRENAASAIRPALENELIACSPRIIGLLNQVVPNHIVSLQKEVTAYLKKWLKSIKIKTTVHQISHPGAINRQGQQGLLDYKKSLHTLRDLNNK